MCMCYKYIKYIKNYIILLVFRALSLPFRLLYLCRVSNYNDLGFLLKSHGILHLGSSKNFDIIDCCCDDNLARSFPLAL